MNAHRLHVTSKRRRNVYLKRMMLVFTALVLVLGISVFYGTRLVDAHDRTDYTNTADHKYYKSIQIVSGDTLWNIAEEYMNENYDSVTEYIDELKKINGLTSDDIQEGQFITIAYFDTDSR